MMFEQLKESPLSISRNRLYFGFACDGTKYYLTSSDKQVLILDSTYIQIGSYTTNRFYYSLCFDPVSDCFWALAIGCPGMLFRLSHEFQEIGRVGLRAYNQDFDSVGGLSYDSCNDRLLFIGGRKIFATDRKGNLTLLSDLRGRENMILSVAAVADGLLYLAVRQNRSYLVSICCQDGKILEKSSFPDDFQARNLLIQPDKSHPGSYDLCIFALKQGYLPCLFECRMAQQSACQEPSCAPENKCGCTPKPSAASSCKTGSGGATFGTVPDSNLINFLFGGLLSEVMHAQTAPGKPQPGGCEPPCRPDKPPRPCSCRPDPCKDNCRPERPPFDCSCGQDNCRPDPCKDNCRPEHSSFDCGCRKPCPPCDCHCNCDCHCDCGCHCNCDCGCGHGCDCHSKCCQQAYADTLESIALAEASLAHILNAEGEKLQKVIASDCSFHELIRVNECVQGTINSATYLEQVLTTKLETLLRNPCCCHCKKPCHPLQEISDFLCGFDPFCGVDDDSAEYQNEESHEN